MKVYYSRDVVKFLKKASAKDRARVSRTREFFEKRGYFIGPKYIKKISGNMWELRAGNVRLFLCARGDKVYGVHAIFKKSQKLKSHDIQLAERRCSEI